MSDTPPRIANGVGGQVRVSALPGDALDTRQMAVIECVRNVTGYPQGAPVHPFFLTLARSPAVFEAFTRLGVEALSQCCLPWRERELVILRTGWLCDAPYQWGEHVHTGREAGLTEDEIEAAKAGSAHPGWNLRDRALLRAVEELVADKTIGEDTWTMLAGHLDEGQLIDLPIIVGHYTMTAYLQNALRFPPNRDAQGRLHDEEAYFGRTPAV